jgi:histidinol dehydrogenase
VSASLGILDWSTLPEAARRAALSRPAQHEAEARLESVREIIAAVRRDGDAALSRFALEFDRVRQDHFEVARPELEDAGDLLGAPRTRALDIAIDNVRRFHEAQRLAPLDVETSPGVRCERRTVPIRAVGLYVPAGSAPLPSTAIMLAAPAQIAGCPERILCTPPGASGRADPAVLYVAHRCEVSRVFALGGAHAIAALAYGTQQIPRVDKIFGPGNAWVTAAKQIAATDADGAACDLPAGPSEVLVIADETARPAFVAADLLAQAEHSPDAQVLLVTTSIELAVSVRRELERQLATLERRDIAAAALSSARLIVVDSLDTALGVSNAYAPEHLILQVARPRAWLEHVQAAGSVFLGEWSPETMGDYCSGTNHVLPTYGHARAWSGLSLLDFTRRITVQELTRAGLRDLGPTAVELARLEGLTAHARAVELRLRALAQEGHS